MPTSQMRTLLRLKKNCFAACLAVVFCAVGQNIAASTASGMPAFRVEADANDKDWFCDPEGRKFLSIGINNVIARPFRPRPNTCFYDPVPNQFPTFEDWKEEVVKLFREHGFNTLGAWSDGGLYDNSLYGTICLYVAAHAADRCLEGLRPGFEDRAEANIKLILDRYQFPAMDKIFGVFLDNEMPWYGHGAWGDIPNYTLLEQALSLPADDGARQAAIRFLKQRYESPEALAAAWGRPLTSWEDLTFDYARSCVLPGANADRRAFIELAAEAFYSKATETVRRMMPGKLILGTRFAAYAPEPVVRACGRYCDVISFNDYRAVPTADPDMLAQYWIWGGRKPLLVTEYSWRARENTSGNPNSGGAGAVVETQAQRGENYQKYIEDLLSYPMVVGAHWFEFADQSPEGRFDGENSNYGVVDIRHRPYIELLDSMKRTNERLESLHARSDRQAPESLPKPRAVVFEPGQRPDRPPMIDLMEAPPVRGPEVFHALDANIEIQKAADHLTLKVVTGHEWGCGIQFFGPAAFKNTSGPELSTNLDGYSVVELDAQIGDSTVFDLFLDEAGVAAPNAPSYDTSGGDDAEGFLIPSNRGSGKRTRYCFELKNLQARKDWGNQKGMRKVDIHAIKGISLYFHGGQGEDTIRLYSLKLVR